MEQHQSNNVIYKFKNMSAVRDHAVTGEQVRLMQKKKEILTLPVPTYYSSTKLSQLHTDGRGQAVFQI